MIEVIIGTKLSGKHSRTRRRGFHRSELLSYLIFVKLPVSGVVKKISQRSKPYSVQ
jgi:hypothetical protein